MGTTRRIVRIDGATLDGRRPRAAGANARLPAHGETVRVPVVRITLDDGTTGFGRTRATPDELRPLVGTGLDDAFAAPSEAEPGGVRPAGRAAEFALWDALGIATGTPAWRLVARLAGRPEPAAAPVARCYDTSLYLDDLHLDDHAAGAALIADEARQGWDRGHRAFKMKVGRGARHMSPEDGHARDVAAIRAVRAAVGPGCPLMVDANNGYTLNLARRVLSETADCRLHWLEEAFHEDPVLYGELRGWIDREGLGCLVADGEGLAAPPLLDWARDGVVQVVQYDIFAIGLTEWMRIGRLLDGWGVRTAPHHYGAHLGNMVSGHLAAAVDGFAFVEWDECTTPGIDTSAYVVDHGTVRLPDAPGFGMHLDDGAFSVAVAAGGFTLRA